MIRKMSMTRAMRIARLAIKPTHGREYHTLIRETRTIVGIIPMAEDKRYYIRNLRAEKTLELMYPEHDIDLSDTLSQPGSLQEIVKMAIADIERV